MECDPRAFFDSYDHKWSDYQKLVFYSEMSDHKIDRIRADHSVEMVIPYVNVPVEGDFSYERERINQIKRMINYNLTSQVSSTVITSTLSRTGLEGYLGCLRGGGSHVLIKADPSTVFERVVNLTLSWHPERAGEGKVSVPILSQGEVVAPYDATLPENGATILQIKRDPDQLCDVSLTINNFPGKIILPPRPKFYLHKGEFTSEQINVSSNHASGYAYSARTAAFAPPDGAEWIPGTTKSVDLQIVGSGYGHITKFEITCDENTLRAHAVAASGARGHGVGVHGKVSAQYIQLRRINYEN